MKISFIIPYHNEPLWMLRECIESILSLSLQPGEREIIVIDDGSKLSPLEELNTISKDIIYRKQENKGLSSARNNAISIANGDYIQFVDSDDKLLPSYNDMVGILHKKNPDILQFMFIRNMKNYHNSAYNILFEGTSAERLCKYNLRAAACMYIFRRDILNNLRFKENIYHEDELFTPQLFAQANTIIDTDAKAYFYRVREESITTTTDYTKIKKRLDDVFDIIVELNAIMIDDPKKLLRRKVSFLIIDYLYNTIALTHSFSEYRKRRQKLKKCGLLPLPCLFYSWKYYLFALMTRFI